MNEWILYLQKAYTCHRYLWTEPYAAPFLFFSFFFLSTSTPFHINNTLQPPMHHCMTHIQQIQSNSSFHPCRASDMIQARRQVTLPCLHWGTCCAFIPNLVNKKGPPVWKLAIPSLYISLSPKTRINIYLQQLTTLHGTPSTRALRLSDDTLENSNQSHGSVTISDIRWSSETPTTRQNARVPGKITEVERLNPPLRHHWDNK